MKPYFQVIDDLGGSLEWSEFFGNHHPVELDIGCGRGLFTFTAANANPDVNYVGLEIDYREGRRAASRIQKLQMPNARIIGGDGNVLLQKLIAPHSVQAAHVYFPDPWWKKKHQKRRIWNQDFVDSLARVLKPGGYVHGWTDVAEYWEVIQPLMDGQDRFAICEPPDLNEPGHDMDYQTSFDRKKRKLGLPIYRGLWQLKSDDANLTASPQD